MEEKRISRREMLRNIGIAGAVVWAAPVLNSLPASAATDVCRKKKAKKLCKGVVSDCTNGFQQCGTCNGPPGDGSYCFEGINGPPNLCAQDVFCADAGQCLTNLDCKNQGLGNACITANGCTGCGRSFGVCSTRCCTPLARPGTRAKPRRLGKTASGR